MSGACPVVRVEWGNPEGFCEINESDFDPKKHKLFEDKPVEPEDGMTAAELKEALTAKGIEFKGNASKASLQALLDAAA